MTNVIFIPLKKTESAKLKEDVRSGKVKKVLINRSDQIGDAVVSLKTISALSKIFSDVTVIASEKNYFIFEEEKLKFLIDKTIFSKARNIFSIYFQVSIFVISKIMITFGKKPVPQYDLVIDLVGDPSIIFRYPSKYAIGPNLRVFSIFYSSWYPYTFAISQFHLIDSYKIMIKHSLGIDLEIDDEPPAAFSKIKKPQIFIFVGNKPIRNLSYSKWKEIIISVSKLAPCIVADDPSQIVMDRLKNDQEVINNNRIKLIMGARELKELALTANESILFLSLDGGAGHYLGRFSNVFEIFTSGLPSEWKPYSVNPYNMRILDKGHVYEETTTQYGLKKMVLYRGKDRKPSYDFFIDFEYYKDVDVGLIVTLLTKFELN